MRYIELTEQQLHDRSINKVASKKEVTYLDIKNIEYDIENNNTGAITMDQLKNMLSSAQREYDTWSYILEQLELKTLSTKVY